jgi:hypothetical protein
MDTIANKVVWLAEDLDYAQGVLEGSYDLPASLTKEMVDCAVVRAQASLPGAEIKVSVELGKITATVMVDDRCFVVKAKNRSVLP